MTRISHQWKSLTPAQHSAWTTFAAAPNEILRDKWGNIITLPAYQWFVRCALRRATVGIPISTTPPIGYNAYGIPSAWTVPQIYSLGICYANWTNGIFGLLDSIIIECAVQYSLTRTKPPNNWRIVRALLNPGDGPINILSYLDATIGRPPLGSQLWARFHKQYFYGNRSPELLDVQTVY